MNNVIPFAQKVTREPLPYEIEAMRKILEHAFPFLDWEDPVLNFVKAGAVEVHVPGVRPCPLCHSSGCVPEVRT